jgi:hypothetical protein
MNLEYLRQVASVPSCWRIQVIEEAELEHDNVAELQYNILQKTATILVNRLYLFTEESYIRTILHELLELATIETWDWFLRSVSSAPNRKELIDEYRTRRDYEIEERLDRMPWFTRFDIPRVRVDVHNF